MTSAASKAPTYSFPLPGYQRKHGIRIAVGAVVSPGARLVGPLTIGTRSVVAGGAHLGPGTVIGSDCRIGPCATVRRSVLRDGVVVDGGTRIVDSVVGYGVRLAKSNLSNRVIDG